MTVELSIRKHAAGSNLFPVFTRYKEILKGYDTMVEVEDEEDNKNSAVSNALEGIEEVLVDTGMCSRPKAQQITSDGFHVDRMYEIVDEIWNELRSNSKSKTIDDIIDENKELLDRLARK